LNQRK